MKLIRIITNPKPYFFKVLMKITNFYRIYFYSGETVICEICNWEGKKFFDNKCPKCNSLSRTRLMPFSLKYFNLIGNGPRILHVAPNTNEFNYIKNNGTDLFNYDRLNIKAVKHINIVQDLTKTDLNPNLYDLSIAWHVLEHIPEDIKAIGEVYRLLKPGGHFLVSVPIYPKGNATTYEDENISYKDYEHVHGHYDHCRSCGFDYKNRFEDLGFKSQTLELNSVKLYDINRFGLSPDHIVWCFTK